MFKTIAMLFAASLLAMPAFSQSGSTAITNPPSANPAGTPVTNSLPPACGAPNAKFEVKTSKDQHPMAQAEAGKALVYFVEDDSEFSSTPKPTTREGLDGQWVGATHGNSYYYVSIAPGEHHLCASWQLSVIVGRGHKLAVAHFTAEAGGVYFFKVKNTWAYDSGAANISLSPLDSDEGKLLVGKFALSTSHLKE